MFKPTPKMIRASYSKIEQRMNWGYIKMFVKGGNHTPYIRIILSKQKSMKLEPKESIVLCDEEYIYTKCQ